MAVAGVVYQVAPSIDFVARCSFSSAYPAITLLTGTLMVAPINALRANRQPVSSDFRRDLGIWAAIWSVAHTLLGLQVHLRGRMLEYFLQADNKPLLSRIRSDIFGAANYSGLLATLLVVTLAAISNDWSLRRMGPARWKRVQRLNYLLFAVVIIHAILYQVVEKRSLPFAVTIGLLASAAIILQIARALFGVRARERV
jgi:sulfoxide reductase heme-binding subunit YedZ